MATPTRAFANSKNHQTSKEAIAKETHTSIDEVDQIYEQELRLLASDAKITQYLGVLTTRRVRAKLRKRGQQPARLALPPLEQQRRKRSSSVEAGACRTPVP